MLHIDGGVYIDSGLKQFFHILIPLCVPASWSIVVSQFIYQNELGLALKGLIQIKFFERDAAIVDFPAGQNFQPLQESKGVWSGMVLHVACHHINPFFLGLVRCLQHRIGFADTCGVSKKDFQFSGGNCAFLTGEAI